MSAAVTTRTGRRTDPAIIARARELWSTGVKPALIADALTAEFGRKLTPMAVHGMAYRNDFARAPERARLGRTDLGTTLYGADTRACSRLFLEAMQALQVPMFNSREANQK